MALRQALNCPSGAQFIRLGNPGFPVKSASASAEGCRTKFFVAQISKSAVSPILIGWAQNFQRSQGWPKVCGLEIRDTAGCNPALRPKHFVLRPPRSHASAKKCCHTDEFPVSFLPQQRLIQLRFGRHRPRTALLGFKIAGGFDSFVCSLIGLR